MIVMIGRIEGEDEVVLTIEDVKESEEERRDKEVDGEERKFGWVGIVIIRRERDG